MLPLLVGFLVFISSLISIRIGIAVVIIEIFFGVILGNAGLKPEEWMLYLANFGGIILTFLAGTEIDMRLLKDKFKGSFLIGFFSFLSPFIIGFLAAYFIAKWTFWASLVTGTAISCTSLAVIYAVLVETGMNKTELGKLLMSATFITNLFTALALSLLFTKFNLYTLVFLAVSILIIFLVDRFSLYILRNPSLFNKVIEPEIKFLLFILLAFVYFAKLGGSQAVLPVFILGMLMSKHFTDQRKTKIIRNRLKTVSYAVFIPIFGIVAGMRVSIFYIYSAFPLFVLFFLVKVLSKFAGVYFFARKYIPQGHMYISLLMSTGLTFGLIAALFGFNEGLINQSQYSLLIGVMTLSSIIPVFFAQKWFMPVKKEDVLR
ncbi:MAG: potassium transporter [Elusimicrobia bacterium RIFOXYA2_FULL_39_19]|nr:MAG: potassium transporter [Elusimicrobia bacterium RIFOXYA2_FULL_39_19]